MINQFEQFVYPGGSREFMNRRIFRSEDNAQPLTKSFCLIIGVPVMWSLFAVMAYIGSDLLWFSLPVLSLLFVRAWLQIVMSVMYNEYVPGSYTSIIVILPLTTYSYSFLLITWQIDYAILMTSIMAALVVHIFFISLQRGRLKALQENKTSEE